MASEVRGATPLVGLPRRTHRGHVVLIADEEPRGLTAGVDGWLLTIIAALCAFGMVMLYSASVALGYAQYRNANYFFLRQLIGLGAGIAGMVIAMRVDYHRWMRVARPLALVTGALLLVVLIPHVGSDRFGARRWITLGSFSVQPSAVAALVALIFLSRWLTERGPYVRTLRGVRDYCLMLALVLALILLERDLGSAIVVGAVGLTLLALAGIRKSHLLVVVSLMTGLAAVLIKTESYRAARLTHFSDPFSDPLNTGFQTVQALYALGSGGLLGVGLGNSIQKYQWLPEAHTDFVFGIIGEELGLLGTMSVIIAFLFLAWRGVRASLRAPDTYGALLAGGITAWICVEAFINIGAVTNVIPTTGIPLPFISYGGTALAATLVGVGILCNVSAQARRQGAVRRAYVDRWRGDGGTPDPRAGRRAGAASR
ncbi:MAG: putative lipid II flippase FtsW [Candidatus Dormibacteria bacterium]